MDERRKCRDKNNEEYKRIIAKFVEKIKVITAHSTIKQIERYDNEFDLFHLDK